MDKRKYFTVGNAVDKVPPKNGVSALFNIGTSWWWNDFNPTWTMIYNPKGNTFLLFPSKVLNPPWTKRYFLKLQAIEVLGSDRLSAGGGLLKGQSLLSAQFQYNFNICRSCIDVNCRMRHVPKRAGYGPGQWIQEGVCVARALCWERSGFGLAV